MPRPPAQSRGYKDLTFQQLRSFSETARLGSLAAAAKSLGLTHPTVREQVLALQSEFQVKLIEPHGRGCHLTVEGRLLAEMIAPIVTSTTALKRRFEIARGTVEARLVVAGTPRIFQEDLPTAVQALLRERPEVRLTFLELRDGQVAQAVESGAAELGLTTQRVFDPPLPGITFEPAYELETLLVTSKKHPLARKRTVSPADLRRYSLISSQHTFSDEPEITAMLDKSRVFDGPKPHVEPFLAATVRAYVERNMGIALLYGQSPGRRASTLHERSMSHYFGRVLVRFVCRPGSANEALAKAFSNIIKQCHRSRSRE